MSTLARALGSHRLFHRFPARSVDIDGAAFSLPLQVFDCDMHIVSGTVAYEPLAALLAPEGVVPVPLHLSDGTIAAVAQLWLNDYRATGIGPYREFMTSFSVAAAPPRGRHVARNYMSALGPFADPECAVLVRWLYLDQPLAIEVGRKVWGFPKLAGSLSFAATGPGHAQLVHETRDDHGRLVVRAAFTRQHGVAAAVRAIAAMPPGIGLGTTLRLLGERTHHALAITPRALKQTRAEVHFEGWVDTFPWDGELELGDAVECGRTLRELGFTPTVVQHMPAVRFVMLAPT